MDITLAHSLGHLIADVGNGFGDCDDPKVLQSVLVPHSEQGQFNLGAKIYTLRIH